MKSEFLWLGAGLSTWIFMVGCAQQASSEAEQTGWSTQTRQESREMEEGADDEQEVIFADLPPSVQQAILRLTTKQAIEETTREMEDGIIVYGVEYADGQRVMSADFNASGKLLELEQEDEESDDEENDHD